MKPTIAKLFLFDALAEQLATLLVGHLPALLALKVENRAETFPDEDIVSLAMSFCRLRFPYLDQVPFCPWSELSDFHLNNQALVLDAVGETLFDINAFLVQSQPLPNTIVIINYHDDGSGQISQISYDLEYRDITQTAIERLFNQLGRECDPLAPIRFMQGGFKRLADDYNLFEQHQMFFNWNDPRTLELFCYRISQGWRYDGKLVDGLSVFKWVNQFKPSGFVYEACEMLIYLKRYGFITEYRVKEHIVTLYKQHVASIGKQPLTMTLQPAGKSESKLAYSVKTTTNILSLDKAIKEAWQRKKRPVEMVCFDDVIGSGQSMRDYIFKQTDLVELFKQGIARLTVLISHADKNGINALCTDPRSYGAVSVKAGCLLDDRYRA
ncbi:MAG: hypothetical protein VSS75_005420, partial [Candidatus Parabeggiatoa sp.]|nr:hypothetical protein [Candidatus Parabeggiatoa sp.]